MRPSLFASTMEWFCQDLNKRKTNRTSGPLQGITFQPSRVSAKSRFQSTYFETLLSLSSNDFSFPGAGILAWQSAERLGVRSRVSRLKAKVRGCAWLKKKRDLPRGDGKARSERERFG